MSSVRHQRATSAYVSYPGTVLDPKVLEEIGVMPGTRPHDTPPTIVMTRSDWDKVTADVSQAEKAIRFLGTTPEDNPLLRRTGDPVMPPNYGPAILTLPVGHLQLRRVTRLALNEVGVHTIGALASALSGDRQSLRDLRPAARREVEVAWERLTASTSSDGHVNWPEFWLKTPAQLDAVYCWSLAFERLSAADGQRPVAALVLKSKTVLSLPRVRVHTVADLIAGAKRGMDAWKAAGKNVIGELHLVLRSLATAIGSDGTIDWDAYARGRSLLLFPDAPTSRSLVDWLPDSLQRALAGDRDKRNWQIFQKRLLTPYAERPTLQDLGDVFRVSRERIRQVEEMMLERVRRLIVGDDYTGFAFRFRDEALEPVRTLAEALRNAGRPALTLPDWLAICTPILGSAAAGSPITTQLLPEILDWRIVEFEVRGLPPVYVPAAADAESYRTALECAWRLLRDEYPNGVDEVELAIAIKRQLRRSAVAPDQLKQWLSFVPELDRDAPAGIFRLKLRWLNRVQQAERVLAAARRPLHFSEICREINSAATDRVVEAENLKNQMSADGRFEPLGRSGQWILKRFAQEANMDTRPWTDIAETILREKGESMDEEQLIRAAEQRRPGSANSLPTMLKTDSRFKKSGYRRWALAKWKQTAFGADWDHDRVTVWVQEYFRGRGDVWVPFGDVCAALTAASNLSPSVARSALIHSGAVDRRVNRYEREVTVARNPAENRRLRALEAGTRSVPRRVHDAVVSDIRAILGARGDHQMQLRDLVAELEKRGHAAPRVYWVVNENTDELLQKFSLEDEGPLWIALSASNPAQYPDLVRIRSGDDQEEATRAILLLTIENVDLGILALGRLLETSLRKFINEVKASGLTRHHVAADDLLDLRRMIDWMVRNGFFPNATAADGLRRERNHRAHGVPPDIQQRRKELKNSKVVATQFLQHIAIVDDLRAKLHYVRTKQLPAGGAAIMPPSK